MSEEKSESNNLKYKTYLEERKLLINAKLEGSRLFDKTIITLAAGSFGLSLAFIKQIVPSNVSNKSLLIFSWIGFGISILSTLISFLASQEGCLKQIEILEKDFFSNDNKNVDINRPAIWTSRLNWLSIISFIIGVIFLASFALINLHKDIGG